MAIALIITGCVTGLLGLLDIFLSEPAKAELNLVMIRLWAWLSDAKKVSWPSYFLHPEYRGLLLAIPVIGTIVQFSYNLYNVSSIIDLRVVGPRDWSVVIGATVAGICLAWALARYLLRNIPHISLRSYLFATTLPFWLLLLSGGLMLSSSFLEWHGFPRLHFTTLWSGVVLFAVSRTSIEFAFIIVLPLIALLILQWALSVVERFVRTIAESPKGVVLTLSGIATAIGTGLKAFA